MYKEPSTTRMCSSYSSSSSSSPSYCSSSSSSSSSQFDSSSSSSSSSSSHTPRDNLASICSASTCLSMTSSHRITSPSFVRPYRRSIRIPPALTSAPLSRVLSDAHVLVASGQCAIDPIDRDRHWVAAYDLLASIDVGACTDVEIALGDLFALGHMALHARARRVDRNCIDASIDAYHRALAIDNGSTVALMRMAALMAQDGKFDKTKDIIGALMQAWQLDFGSIKLDGASSSDSHYSLLSPINATSLLRLPLSSRTDLSSLLCTFGLALLLARHFASAESCLLDSLYLMRARSCDDHTLQRRNDQQCLRAFVHDNAIRSDGNNDAWLMRWSQQAGVSDNRLVADRHDVLIHGSNISHSHVHPRAGSAPVVAIVDKRHRTIDDGDDERATKKRKEDVRIYVKAVLDRVNKDQTEEISMKQERSINEKKGSKHVQFDIDHIRYFFKNEVANVSHHRAETEEEGNVRMSIDFQSSSIFIAKPTSTSSFAAGYTMTKR